MVHIVFAPNFRLEVDLPPELASNPELPENIAQFWPALELVAFSQQPHIDEGVGASHVPAKLLNVTPNIQAFWVALRPIMMQIIDQHPTLVGKRGSRYGRVPDEPTLISQFGSSMLKLDPETGQPRWQSFKAERDQSYAVWVLREFFVHCTGGPGFPI
jgi:hypothetical protein